MRSLTGGCLCGAVRYVASGEPVNVRVCHCEQCRRSTGGAFWARALYSQDDVAIEGATAGYPTSGWLERVFCPKCGATLFSRSLDDRNVMGVSLVTLDHPAALAPTEHIFAEEMLPWLHLDDGLPRHARRPPG